MARYKWHTVLAALSLLCGASVHGEVKVTEIDGTGRPAIASAAMTVDKGRIIWVGPRHN